MGIVDPEYASPSWIVQRQRVTDRVRAMCVGRHVPRHDLHLEATADLDQKAVEIEEPVETLVAPAHLVNISDNDNNRYDPPLSPRSRARHRVVGNRDLLNDQTGRKADEVRVAGAATHAEENTSGQAADRIAVELK